MMHVLRNYDFWPIWSNNSNLTWLFENNILWFVQIFIFTFIKTFERTNRTSTNWISPMRTWDSQRIASCHLTMKSIRLCAFSKPCDFLFYILELMVITRNGYITLQHQYRKWWQTGTLSMDTMNNLFYFWGKIVWF